MLKAIWRIKAGKVYEPGEVIAGLSPAEEKRLILLGAAQPVAADPAPEPEKVAEEQNELEGLRAVLKTLNKKELLAYAEQAGLRTADKLKVDEITAVILKDAEEKGVDIEAFTDEQLKVFAGTVGAAITEGMAREELLSAIEAKFGALKNA